ncbi:MAG: hypothetical protein KC478_11830 [Bacteriovoracaceae bacterium]|nr:hypothetical protein [Bacteriovoracaceae bacterium]
MKQLLLGLTLLASASVFAHGDNDTSSNKICGISDIPLANIHNASKEARVVETMKLFKSEGYTNTVCEYGEGVAVVAVYPNDAKWVLIFNN